MYMYQMASDPEYYVHRKRPELDDVGLFPGLLGIPEVELVCLQASMESGLHLDMTRLVS